MGGSCEAWANGSRCAVTVTKGDPETSVEERLGRFERVLDQRRDRHRPDAAGNRSDPRSALGGRPELDVPDEAPVSQPVDADVDDDRTGLGPPALDDAGAPDCDDDD